MAWLASNQVRFVFRTHSEHLALDQQSLEHLVEGTHADIRQVLNLLSTFRLTANAMTYDQAKDLYAIDLRVADAATCSCLGLIALGHVFGVCVCARALSGWPSRPRT